MKPQEESYKRDVENGGDSGGRSKKQRRQENIDSVDIDTDNPENRVDKKQGVRRKAVRA